MADLQFDVQLLHAEAGSRVLAIHHDEVEPEFATQPRHFLDDRIAAGAADDVAAKHDFHALDKGASTPVGQQPIQPLVVGSMRHLGHELQVEADADRRHPAPFAQIFKRSVIETAAIA